MKVCRSRLLLSIRFVLLIPFPFGSWLLQFLGLFSKNDSKNHQSGLGQVQEGKESSKGTGQM